MNLVPTNEKKRALVEWKAMQQHLATPEEVLSWHLQFRAPVWANVTGKISNRISLDADGPEGCATFDRLGLTELAHRETPSGGLHVDFVWPGFHILSINQGNAWLREHLPSVDIRGDGGIAAVAGGHVKGSYRWLRDLEAHSWAALQERCPDLADYLRRRAEQRERPAKPATARSEASSSEGLPEHEIEGRIAQAIGQTRRAGGSFHAAQLTIGNRFPDVESEEAMEPVLAVACRMIRAHRPEREETEIRRVVLDGWKHARAKGWAAPKPVSASSERTVTTRAASSVQPEAARFLDPQRTMPVGALAMDVGNPGLGKSTLACYRTAAVTSGRGGWRPGAVLFVTAEDSIAATLVPRLKAAGADLDRVHFVEARTDGQPDGIRLPDDVEALRELVEKHRAVYVVIDPLAAHLPAEINSWRDQDVRRALAPLATLAEECACSVDVIAHLNKARGADPIYRVAGSIGTVGAARSVVLMTEWQEPEGEEEAEDGGDEDTSALRVVTHLKCNVGPRQPAAIYELQPATITGEAGQEIETSRLVYRRRSSHQAADLLDPPKRSREGKGDTARELLLDALGDGRQHDAAEVKRAIAQAAGCSERTVKRIADGLRIEAATTSEFPPRTLWRLRERFGGREITGSPASSDGMDTPEVHTNEVGSVHTVKSAGDTGYSASGRGRYGQSIRVSAPGEEDRYGHAHGLSTPADNPFLAAEPQSANASQAPASSQDGRGTIHGCSALRLEDFAR